MTFRSAAIALLTLFVAPAVLRAQAPSDLPKLLTLPASTRAMALGNAYVPTERHADALFYHPALVARASGFGLDVQRWGGASSSATASAAMEWFGGGIGVGLQTMQYRASSPDVPSDQDVLFADGDVPVSERVASLAYGRSLAGFEAGLAGKLGEVRVGGARDAEVTVDVGLAHEVGPLMAAVTVKDIGKQVFNEEDGRDAGTHPTRVLFGVGAYGREVGIFDVGVAGQLSYSADQTVAGAGVEIGYWPISGRTFVGRVGVQSVPDLSGASPLTFGFAYWGDDLVLEWAYQDFGDLGEGTHRVGVRWR